MADMANLSLLALQKETQNDPNVDPLVDKVTQTGSKMMNLSRPRDDPGSSNRAQGPQIELPRPKINLLEA